MGKVTEVGRSKTNVDLTTLIDGVNIGGKKSEKVYVSFRDNLMFLSYPSSRVIQLNGDSTDIWRHCNGESMRWHFVLPVVTMCEEYGFERIQ